MRPLSKPAILEFFNYSIRIEKIEGFNLYSILIAIKTLRLSMFI